MSFAGVGFSTNSDKTTLRASRAVVRETRYFSARCFSSIAFRLSTVSLASRMYVSWPLSSAQFSPAWGPGAEHLTEMDPEEGFAAHGGIAKPDRLSVQTNLAYCWIPSQLFLRWLPKYGLSAPIRFAGVLTKYYLPREPLLAGRLLETWISTRLTSPRKSAPHDRNLFHLICCG